MTPASVPDAARLEIGQSDNRDPETPLVGCYPFGAPGEPVVLWYAMAQLKSRRGRSAPRPVRVELAWNEGARIMWTIAMNNYDDGEDEHWSPPAEDGQVLILGARDRAPELPVYVRSLGDGWSNGTRFGGDESLVRVVAHWVNLPDFARGKWLRRPSDGHEWLGRSDFIFDGWHVRFDSRPDIRETCSELKRTRAFAITHVMELRRSDGTSFSSAKAEELLAGLQFAISYAIGRGACPAAPVGFNEGGRAVWSAWEPLNAESANRGSQAWWPNHKVEDLAQYLKKFMEMWAEPFVRDQLRFLVSWATAASDGTYIEARTTLALSTLEHLSWIEEVLEGDRNEDAWRTDGAAKRLRKLLQRCRVDLQIDPTLTPALGLFAQERRLSDGPGAIVNVRDALTHPKEPAGLYSEDGLIAEASRLACRYLDLVILHRIGYRGDIKNRTKVRGSAGESERAPWVK